MLKRREFDILQSMLLLCKELLQEKVQSLTGNGAWQCDFI